jgi:hypothetical protein
MVAIRRYITFTRINIAGELACAGISHAVPVLIAWLERQIVIRLYSAGVFLVVYLPQKT